MIEYPESHVLATQMQKTLVGKTVESVKVLTSPHSFAFYSECRDAYNDMLVGRTVTDARAVGGLPELWLGDLMLYFGDGAYPRYFENNAPKKHQLLVEFTDGTGISVTIAMYGGMWLEPINGTRHEYHNAAQQKNAILSDAFTYEYFRSLLPDTGKKLSAKAFLATEQRIPGLGNGVLQDILWNAGISPKRDVRTLADENFHDLYAAVVKTVSAMTLSGGRDTEKDLFGVPGGYKTVMCKKLTNMICPRCGGAVKKENYMGGAVYYCMSCQE